MTTELSHFRNPQRMKLQADTRTPFSISSYGEGSVVVNGVRMSGAMLVCAQTGPQPWVIENLASLRAENFDHLALFKPELVIFGSGRRLKFPHPSHLQGLIDLRVGLETMDSAAACRTFNVLASEGRRVLLALLPLDFE